MAKDAAEEFEGFVDLGNDVEDIHEPLPVPTGAYDLTVSSAKGIFEDKEGQKVMTKIRCMVDFDGQPNAATMFHNLSLPLPGDEPKSRKFKITLIKKFYKLFNVPVSSNGINTTDLIGAQAKNALVELSSYDKGDGTGPRESNKLNLNSVHV